MKLLGPFKFVCDYCGEWSKQAYFKFIRLNPTEVKMACPTCAWRHRGEGLS